MVSIYSHEVVETTSDYLGAWYFDPDALDPNGYPLGGYENADACVWNFGDTYLNEEHTANVRYGDKLFLVQMNWVPGFGCMLSL